MKAFLTRKNIHISFKVYCLDTLSHMAQGLFASLLIGLIIKTTGEQVGSWLGVSLFSTSLIQIGTTTMNLMGSAIGVAVAFGLQAPPLVLYSCVIGGAFGALLGGPAGALVASIIGCEFGKAISKETKLDILVTPLVTIIMSYIAAMSVGPLIQSLMNGLGSIIMSATVMQPFFMGIIISLIMGLVLTAPISSAALAIMLNLSGLAAGAATVGCCAQMIGFAIISYKDNGIGGFFAQGLGTSMLQIPNIIKNLWILLPPSVASIILGPLSTCLFKMSNIPSGAGMGTSGLVGQIGTLTTMGFSLNVFLLIILLHFILPALISYIIYRLLKHYKKIKDGDMKLDI